MSQITILDDVVNKISGDEWNEFFKLDPNYIVSKVAFNSEGKKEDTKVSEPMVVVEKFNEFCVFLADKTLNLLNLEIILMYDRTLAENIFEQNSITNENVLLKKIPMLGEETERYLRIMIANIVLFHYLYHHTFKCNNNANLLKFLDKIAKYERKIVYAISDSKLCPTIKQFFQYYCMRLWLSISKHNEEDIAHSGVWLSTVLRDKVKKCSSSRIHSPSTENKIEKEQRKATKRAHKELNTVLHNIENVSSKMQESNSSNQIRIDDVGNEFDGIKSKELDNKVESNSFGKLQKNTLNYEENDTNVLKNSLLKRHQRKLLEQVAIAGETSDEGKHKSQLHDKWTNSASYPPYTLDTLNDCILALAKVIAVTTAVKDEFFVQYRQVEVRDLSLVFEENVSTESATENNDHKRLKEVELNFLFAAYRAIVYALKQSEGIVENSHLNGLIERNKRIFVDIILRSKKFEQNMRERNAPHININLNLLNYQRTMISAYALVLFYKFDTYNDDVKHDIILKTYRINFMSIKVHLWHSYYHQLFEFIDKNALKSCNSLMTDLKNIAATPKSVENMIGFLNLNDIVCYYHAKDIPITHTRNETAQRWIVTYSVRKFTITFPSAESTEIIEDIQDMIKVRSVSSAADRSSQQRNVCPAGVLDLAADEYFISDRTFVFPFCWPETLAENQKRFEHFSSISNSNDQQSTQLDWHEKVILLIAKKCDDIMAAVNRRIWRDTPPQSDSPLKSLSFEEKELFWKFAYVKLGIKILKSDLDECLQEKNLSAKNATQKTKAKKMDESTKKSKAKMNSVSNKSTLLAVKNLLDRELEQLLKKIGKILQARIRSRNDISYLIKFLVEMV